MLVLELRWNIRVVNLGVRVNVSECVQSVCLSSDFLGVRPPRKIVKTPLITRVRPGY